MVKVAVLHEYILFNTLILMDIMYIQGRSVLHVVDKGIHYQAAKFLHDDSIETISKAFMQMRCGISWTS